LFVTSESGSQIVNILDSLKIRMENSTGKERIENMIAYGRMYAETDVNRSCDILMQSISESKDKNYYDCLVKAYTSINYPLIAIGKADSAYYYLNEAINIAEKNGYRELLGISFTTLGFYYFVNDNYKQSYQAFNISDSILTIINSDENLCRNYVEFSRLLYYMDEYDMGISYLYKGLEISQKNGYKNITVDLLNQLALTYHQSRKYDEIENILNRAILLSEENNYFFGLSETYQIFGDYHTDFTKNYVQAETYYSKAYEISMSLGMKSHAATAYNKISHVLMLENKSREALVYAEKSYKLREESGFEDVTGSSLINIGFIYNSLKEYDKASDYILQGLKIAKNIDILANGYKNLYNTKLNTRDYEAALESYKMYNAYKDSITKRESFKSVSRIELKYELEKSMNEIRNMEYELQTNKLTYTIIFSVGLLFATIISTIAFLSKRKTNLQLQKINVDNEKIIDERTEELKKEISVRIKAEQDLQEALKNEKHLNELKSRFVSMVSHEFRTPLTGIETSADLMKINIEKRNETSKNIKYLQRIYNELNRLTAFLDDILLFSKTDSGKIKFTPSETEIPSLIINLIEYLKRNNKNFIPPNSINCKGNQRKVFCDRNMMETIFTNLFINANKYSPENTKWDIEMHFEEKYLEINISDNGIGIPENEIAFLFDSFYRGSNTTGIPGTGIGLVTVKQMIDEHNGTISVKNNPDRGVTFTIKLPYSFTN
jgi:signal transduction histidine kinase